MVNKEKSRIDIIGQNGNTGEHYEEVMPNERWNWYGEGEDQPVKMDLAQHTPETKKDGKYMNQKKQHVNVATMI